jgi:hypothetical protein
MYRKESVMKVKITKESLIAWLTAGLMALALSATADAEDFYAGKTIRFIVGMGKGIVRLR